MHEYLPDNGGGSGEIHGSLQTLPLPTTSGHVVYNQNVLIVAPQQVLYSHMHVCMILLDEQVDSNILNARLTLTKDKH